eukprot:TRINITY_DN32792_c0_g1_i1.p1 TRINITY_DN32792_c0_g1~~TRINITY_DN32792_c0_g1_i1.p1  ORF type:complete len:156 (-),score=17.08 TRINITY_DN32792_c0_g1_i1:81-548(-)
MSTWANLRNKFRTGERCVEASCHGKRGDVSEGDEVGPPDRAEIGRATWRYLHTMAANYPERPSKEERNDAQAWLTSFVQFYPCSHCAEGFVEICDAMPPKFGSRQDYAVWWCEAHNKVSEELKNETRKCDLTKLLASGSLGIGLDELPANGKGTE